MYNAKDNKELCENSCKYYSTLWNFVPMMFVMLNKFIQGLRLIHEVYTLFQDRRGETEPKGSLGMEKNN